MSSIQMLAKLGHSMAFECYVHAWRVQAQAIYVARENADCFVVVLHGQKRAGAGGCRNWASIGMERDVVRKSWASFGQTVQEHSDVFCRKRGKLFRADVL